MRYSAAALLVVFLCGAAAAAPVVSVGQNFTGSVRGVQSSFIPPDTMGAVGPSHVMELINGRYSVYSKAGVLQTGSSLNAFWTAAGATPSGSFAFDPRVVYDAHSGRWFATAVDNAGGANNFLVAVSAGSDPTGTWNGYKIDSDSDNSHWADFPMMGLNQDVVTITANMFSLTGGSANKSILVLPKADLLDGTFTVGADETLFEGVDPNGTGFALQPAFDLDNGNLNLTMLSAYNKGAGALKLSEIGGSAVMPTLVTAGGFLTVTSRGLPPDMDQPGAKQDIDAGDNRFSGNVVLQGGNLWAVHGVEIGGRAAIEWYRIDPVAGTVLESGTISDASLAFNYPSIAVNDFGDVVIGFSGSDANTFVSTYAVTGFFNGATTVMGPRILLKAGNADYQRLDSASPPRNRWGDYSATVVDPSNQRHFWTFQEFVFSTDNWGIQVTEIVFTPTVIPEPSTVALFGLGILGLTGWRIRRRKKA